jgi:5-(carboxyamino)imidazole ribonucleotide synthase
MYFNPHSNLVEFLFSPATVSETIAQLCTELATRAVVNLNAVGVFAVELFVDPAGRVFINEIAPRPHNSGHHTIEGCYTSQFEQLNRILLGLPLGSTALVQPSAMINLVGPADLSGAYRLEHAETLLQMEGVYIHLYNKKEIRPNRKMGHVTVMAETHDALIEKAAKVRALCQFVAG